MSEQKIFNREMIDYLDKRKGEKKSFMDMISGSDRHMEPKRKVKKVVEEEMEEIEEIEEEEEELETKKEGILKRLLKDLRIIKEYDDVEDAEMEESYPELEEDIKKVLRITFDWINQLPSDKKVKFKQSQDFVEYKAILKKYGLIKEVENAPTD